MSGADEDIGQDGSRRVAPRVPMSIEGLVVGGTRPAHEVAENITPAGKLFVLAHLGIPAVSADSWKLRIAGLVERELELTLTDLAELPGTTVRAVHNCAGNPMQPTVPTRTVANVEWGGVLLRDLLERARPVSQGSFVWAFGLDAGAFAGHEQAHYVKDLPLVQALASEVLIATTVNGAPLSEAHGFPARLLVPGFYGNNSVKWLCRLEVADRRVQGLFTTRLYNDRRADGSRQPVWRLEPDSLIVSPAAGPVRLGTPVTVSGWAWSYSAVRSVGISIDGARSWQPARLEARSGYEWQRFECEWIPDTEAEVEICARATDADGRTQPLSGARNEVHRVSVRVSSDRR